ncbi:MAG: RNA-binding S4 domain-containing protein [Chitinophagales bacterium]
MEKFEISGEYIQLNQLLKALNWCESGAHANTVIDEGLVTVNGKTELRKRNKIYKNSIISFENYKVKVV